MKNKKAQVGLDIGKKVLLILLSMGIIAFAMIITFVQLDAADPSEAGGTTDNLTTGILNNISGGVEGFFGNAGAWFALLAIVVLILIIAIVIFAVNRFGGSRGL